MCIPCIPEVCPAVSASHTTVHPAPSPTSSSCPSPSVHIRWCDNTTAAAEPDQDHFAAAAEAAVTAEGGTSTCNGLTFTPAHTEDVQDAAEAIGATSSASPPLACVSAGALEVLSMQACLGGSRFCPETPPSPTGDPSMLQLACPATTNTTQISPEVRLPLTPLEEEPVEVTLCVHRPRQSTLRGRMLKFVLHSTVEFNGDHLSFGPEGYHGSDPILEGWELYKKIPMGLTIVPRPVENDELKAWLLKSFARGTYRKLGHNCNDFASELCWMLVRKEAPEWINHLARTTQRWLCLSLLRPLPYALTHRPSFPLATPLQPHTLPPCPATAPPADTPSSYNPCTVAPMSPARMIQDSPPALDSLPTAPAGHSEFLPVPVMVGLQRDTAAPTPHNLLQPNNPTPQSSPSTIPETATPAQQPSSQPGCPPDATHTSPSQPPASSAPPPYKSTSRHRGPLLKLVCVPKHFAQKAVQFFCCGRSGMVKN